MQDPTNAKVLQHYLTFSLFTYPGLFKESLIADLPNGVREIGQLVRNQIIHRVILKNLEVASNEELEQGTTTKIPWYRQPEDANLTTAAAMLAELYRRDERGFVQDRAAKDKLILTCRPVAILMASILKSKGIPARVRSGFASYLLGYGVDDVVPKDKSIDHWINEYWDERQNHWVRIDVDGSEVITGFDPYDIPDNILEYSADVWLDSREGKVDPRRFWNARPSEGLIVIAWELFHDFHCLMNNENMYIHHPGITMPEVFSSLREQDLKEIDELSKLMQKPDDNFDKLIQIWQTNEKFRLLDGPLLYNS